MPTFSNEQRVALAVGIPVAALLLFLWFRRRRRSESFGENDVDEDEEGDDVASGFETTIEVKIPRTAVGAVIGKGGANIRRIQKESGARLNLKDDEECSKESTERMMLVHGERDKAKRAELMVLNIIKELPVVLTEEIFVPQSACGRIIGKGGQNIRDMSRVSGAKITIERIEDRSSSALRQCQITGSAEQIKDAKGLLNEKIAEDTEMRERRGAQGFEGNGRHYSNKKYPCIVSSQIQLQSGDSYFKVFVSAMENPGHFWVQPITDHSSALESLTKDLNILYSGSASDLVLNGFTVGDLCCAPFQFDDHWYRAEILEVCKDGTVDLYYVDYGDTGKVAKDNLRELRNEHIQLPFQAVECSLANVRPAASSGWTDEACDKFEQLTHCAEWTVVMAKVVKYCGSIPCLELVDTSGETDLSISEEMVQLGHGLHDEAYPMSPPPGPRDKTPGSVGGYPGNRQPLDHCESSSHQIDQQYQSPQNVDLSSLAKEPGLELHQSSQAVDLSSSAKRPGEEGTDGVSREPLQFQDIFDGPLQDPIRPKRESPVKAALLKRTSRDYINAPGQEQVVAAAVSSTVFAEAPPLDWGQARFGVEEEEGEHVMGPPPVDGQLRSVEPTSSERQQSETKSAEPITVADYSVSTSANQSEQYGLSCQSSSSHHQVTHSQKGFVSSVTVTPRGSKESRQQYRVTRSVAKQHEKSYAVESVTRHVTDHSLALEPASVTHFGQEKPSVMSEYKVTFENSNESFAVPKAGEDLFEAERGETATDTQQPLAEIYKYSCKKEVSSTRHAMVTVDWNPEISERSDMSPSGSLLNISGNTVIDEEEEEEEEEDEKEIEEREIVKDSGDGKRERSVGNVIKEEEVEGASVEDGESDSDSFMSTREDVTSDTDTAGYVTAPVSSASVEYLSVDTDTDTLDFESAREDGTPVNSDDDNEEEDMHDPCTPTARCETLKEFEAADQLDTQTFLLDAAVASNSELGYRADTEEGLAPEEGPQDTKM